MTYCGRLYAIRELYPLRYALSIESPFFISFQNRMYIRAFACP
jgi:hypothetical protein